LSVVTTIEAFRVRCGMSRHSIIACTQRCAALLAFGTALAGCGSPTGPETLTVHARTVDFVSEAEQRAWPSTPTVQGGPGVIVRGMAFITCARPIGTATRHAHLIELHVAGDPAQTICPAIVAGWQPVEATIVGLAPGSYRVRVTMVGHIGRAEWLVNVIQP
jgi:hypothetical protein